MTLHQQILPLASSWRGRLLGTNRTTSDVRSSVANGGKPDLARIAQFDPKMG
jgi:hypothetical protein